MWPFRPKFPEPEPTQAEVIAAVAMKEVTMAHRKWIWKNAMAPGIIEGIKRKDRIRAVILIATAFLMTMPLIVGAYEVGHSSARVRFTFAMVGNSTDGWELGLNPSRNTTVLYGQSIGYAFMVSTGWCRATIASIHVQNGTLDNAPVFPIALGQCEKYQAWAFVAYSISDTSFGDTTINVHIVVETA